MHDHSHLLPLIYALIAGSSTLIGFWLSLKARSWVKKYSMYFVSLGAGVMLGTAFFHILPETQEILGPEMFIWVLAGFMVFFMMESLMGMHACQEVEEKHVHKHVLGSMSGAGILLHSLLDGVAIAIGYEVDPHLGLITAIAVMLHELPEGIFTFGLLTHSGIKKSKASWLTVAVALATPVGTAATLLFAPGLTTGVLGKLLALAAGSFLYIAAADLVPESHKSRSLKISLTLILGVIMTFFLMSSKGHSHDEEIHEDTHEQEVHDELEHTD